MLRWYRLPMSGAIARITMSLMSFGISGFLRRGGETSSPDISFPMSDGAGVSYGSMPVSI